MTEGADQVTGQKEGLVGTTNGGLGRQESLCPVGKDHMAKAALQTHSHGNSSLKRKLILKRFFWNNGYQLADQVAKRRAGYPLPRTSFLGRLSG